MAGRKRGASLEERLAAIRTGPADDEAPELDGPGAPHAEFEPQPEFTLAPEFARAEPFAQSASFQKFAALESAIVGELAEVLEPPAPPEVPDVVEEPYEFFETPEPEAIETHETVETIEPEAIETHEPEAIETIEPEAIETHEPEAIETIEPPEWVQTPAVTAPAVSFFAPAPWEPPEPLAAPEPVAAPDPVAEAEPEPFESADSFFSFGSFVSQTAVEQRDPEPTPANAGSSSTASLLSFAAEGDTFLPGSVSPPVRLDVAGAKPTAVGPQPPEAQAPAPPADAASSHPETPRAPKVRRGWGRKERREVPAEVSAETAIEPQPDGEEVAAYAPPPVEVPSVEVMVEDDAPAIVAPAFVPPAFVAPAFGAFMVEDVAPVDEAPQIEAVEAVLETEPEAIEPEPEPEVAIEPEAEPTAAEAHELDEIIAEIAEISEVASPPPAAWVPVRGRIPKPRPFAKPETEAVVPEVDEDVVDEPVVDEVVEPEPVEPEPEPEPEPEVEVAAEPEPEPIVVEVAPEPEFAVSEQAEVDEFVAEAEFIEAVGTAVDRQATPGVEEVDDDSPWTRRVRTERFGRIGTTLIDRGLITNEQLDEALEIQRTSGRRVGDILVELGALSSFELARVLADHMGVPFTDLRTKPPDPIIAALLPEDVARRYDALPIQRWNDQLVVAMANPTDLFALDDLQMVTRQPIIAAMAVKEDLRAAIDQVYRVSIVETVESAKVDYGADVEAAALSIDEADEGPIVGLVNALMGQAITDHASDLHIEPCSTHIAIRMRIDGVLHDASTVPLELLRPVVSRVKILAGLDIAQNRLAQDGRFSLTIDGRSVDVRVVTMPTSAGEAVILRLLDPIRDALGVSSLGLSPEERARFIPAFQASQGAVFIAGPTGSGKTSTIYAVLSEVNTRTKSIVSVENPVEFRLDGIKQMQINARAGLTFPTALPTVLRADPDVVFIGEVRDTDTARIAADAAITGHLVLSTLHATRAASAPMRLIEMGVEPYLVASALTLVASQRLARKLCEHCAEPADTETIDKLRGLGATDDELHNATVRRAVGCAACRGTGYRGRLPIFEIMPVTEGVSRLILERASRAVLEDLAVEEGMDTMLRASIKRVVRGDLSVEEMLRIVS